MEDHGTPEDPSDDYPAVAPEVDYYYRLVPMIGSCKGPSSPLIHDRVSWGDRRLLSRDLPDSQRVRASSLIVASVSGCSSPSILRYESAA